MYTMNDMHYKNIIPGVQMETLSNETCLSQTSLGQAPMHSLLSLISKGDNSMFLREIHNDNGRAIDYLC